ncbi:MULTISPECIES: squalene synthase HpnC [Amycolatopsis]|uniref:Squalene synthase HpnC n=1 Tax=Amycolatopsis thermalba TaxID=944492 RepID=A0ABY4NZK2_9PSEU|nr:MULTISPECIES: squalene synthase HpnC [Amycolatopsis]OXM64947.1 squalene synthase HpnC [Amycolatopsis sp. KNN50.9b]UQS25526.1 squalene synthase HpnC [Amycolatopsis thermalba]
MAPAPPGPGTVGDRALREKEHAENFPVALRILPRDLRADLVAVYDVARVIDDLGDESAAADRTPGLLRFQRDLERAFRGDQPHERVLRDLLPAIRRRDLELDPFNRLVRANLQDQRVATYATQAELEDYCVLSADPVGRIVLRVFGVRDPAAERLSDRVCTALQLIEHCQDVAEDRRNGRVYLPQADLAAFGATEADLDAPTTSRPVRLAVAAQTARALDLLTEGAALLDRLHGWARLAVAGYIAGGLATLDALRRARWDVLAGTPRPRKTDVLAHLIALLVRPAAHVRRIREGGRLS